MPLKPNEAGRLRGMIARLIVTKEMLDNCLATDTSDGLKDTRRAEIDYQKAREKLNNYILILERQDEKV